MNIVLYNQAIPRFLTENHRHSYKYTKKYNNQELHQQSDTNAIVFEPRIMHTQEGQMMWFDLSSHSEPLVVKCGMSTTGSMKLPIK